MLTIEIGDKTTERSSKPVRLSIEWSYENSGLISRQGRRVNNAPEY